MYYWHRNSVKWNFNSMIFLMLAYFYFSPLETNLRTLIKLSRPYFPIEATQEMLEEWRPLMCPFDMTMVKAMSYYSMFLPTFNTQLVKDQTFGLWFDEFMSFWRASSNAPLYEGNLFSIFSR